MLILVLLGMHFDAVGVFVTSPDTFIQIGSGLTVNRFGVLDGPINFCMSKLLWTGPN